MRGGSMNEFTYRHEINLTEIADEYAKRLEAQVDEMVLDRAAHALERFGYVKVIRCRDCKYYEGTGNCYFWASYEPIPGGDEYREVLAEVTPNGFCAWGERRDDA